MGIETLQQLETLLKNFAQDQALSASLSLVETAQIEGSRAVIHSLLVAEVARRIQSEDAGTRDQE